MGYVTVCGDDVQSSEKRQLFIQQLKAFLSLNEKQKSNVDLTTEFNVIEAFISNQPTMFLEETLLNATSLILEYIQSAPHDDYLINFSNKFVIMLRHEKFKPYLEKIQRYGTAKTLGPIRYFLEQDKISLADSFTRYFLLEQNRNVTAFPKDYYGPIFVEQCLKTTKIAALDFLLKNYKGFNDINVQKAFLAHSDMNKEILSTVFFDKKYVSNMDSEFNTFLNKDSITLDKKLEIIDYFSSKEVPNILAQYVLKGLDNNNISIKTLSNYSFYEKLINKKTLLDKYNGNANSYAGLKDYLETKLNYSGYS